MIVLKIIGCIILAVIALIMLVLCIKVRIFAEYSEIDTRVRVQWLFLKKPLYPSAAKGSKGKAKDSVDSKGDSSTQKSAATEENSDPVASPDEQKSTDDSASQADSNSDQTPESAPKQKNILLKTLYDAHGIDGLLLIVNRTFGYVGTYFGDLSKSLVIDELYVDVRCTKKDAASTAIYYGEVCSALFPMFGALVSKYKVRKYDINVYPDYLARQSSASFAVSMHLYPIHLTGVTVLFGCRMLFKVLLRLFWKIFLPNKKENAENSNKVGSQKPITEK